MDKYEALSQLFLFDGSDFNRIDCKYRLTELCCEKSFNDGELIIDAAYTDGLPVLTDGAALIISGDGGKSAVLKEIRPGDCFGAGTLFAKGAEHTTKVRSKGRCTLVEIPKELLLKILEGEPECAVRYIRFLSDKTAFLNKKITAFTAGSAEAKLAVYLLSLELSDCGSAVLDMSLSALSSSLGIGRASLYRALETFESEGIIQKKARNITLLKPERLRAVIQNGK